MHGFIFCLHKIVMNISLCYNSIEEILTIMSMSKFYQVCFKTVDLLKYMNRCVVILFILLFLFLFIHVPCDTGFCCSSLLDFDDFLFKNLTLINIYDEIYKVNKTLL